MRTAFDDLTVSDLVNSLKKGVEGSLSGEAAVQLLVDQEGWLRRRDFRAFVDFTDDPAVTGGQPQATVRWREVAVALEDGRLRASSAEYRVLRIAASLGGGVPVDLREVATNMLGAAHAAYVVRAVTHATGRESSPSAVLAKGLDLIASLVDDDECWYDDDGGCREHGYLDLELGERCPVQEAKIFLGEQGREGESRA